MIITYFISLLVYYFDVPKTAINFDADFLDTLYLQSYAKFQNDEKEIAVFPLYLATNVITKNIRNTIIIRRYLCPF